MLKFCFSYPPLGLEFFLALLFNRLLYLKLKIAELTFNSMITQRIIKN
jgi:hypothetical protein